MVLVKKIHMDILMDIDMVMAITINIHIIMAMAMAIHQMMKNHKILLVINTYFIFFSFSLIFVV